VIIITNGHILDAVLLMGAIILMLVCQSIEPKSSSCGESLYLDSCFGRRRGLLVLSWTQYCGVRLECVGPCVATSAS